MLLSHAEILDEVLRFYEEAEKRKRLGTFEIEQGESDGRSD